MIRTTSSKQLTIAEFDWPFETALDKHNRWVKLSECIPWDELAECYYQGMRADRGRPLKDARRVIGAVIIKHKLCLSDVETVQQIQENPYLQYFVGLPGYQAAAPFAPSLLVEVRKRMGEAVFEGFHRAIIEAHEGQKPTPTKLETPPAAATPAASEPKAAASVTAPEAEVQPEAAEAALDFADKDGVPSAPEPEAPAAPRGQLILDATVVEQAIRFPTDLSLLNEARELTERIIDTLCKRLKVTDKPRTYRHKARSAYLAVAKQKRPGRKVLRRGIKQQWQYLRRNLSHIEQLLAPIPQGSPLPLPGWLLHRYWVIQHLYQQQWDMYRNQTRRCDRRIVSISQPYVRPMVRGKLDKPVEFGAKLSVSLSGEGLAHVDHLRWDAFHEGLDLVSQVEAYLARYGHYPERVLADPIYGTRANRDYLKQHGIRFAGKPLGRPKRETEANREQLKHDKEQRRQEYLQRIPIEGKFDQGKNGYRLNDIRAKRANTSFAWFNTIFLVMNLLVLQGIFFALGQCRLVGLLQMIVRAWKQKIWNLRTHSNLADPICSSLPQLIY
ncbi:IS5 family transposase [Methylomonas montana]|uniref:IS5 family transposase n=1 Tax=Methylomonas montana TaxID=3058963 RepID=UPI00265A68EA|nr:IS5 family transposase [Methylomonas montana]WKJ90312.1 IS5 family transposase [Methylomonas montana]WKJ90390.1 IS5 family transposase [Methylomonas montana]